MRARVAAETARRLDLPIKELLRLVHEREIRYVMVNGIAHIPEDALDEYRREAASPLVRQPTALPAA